MAELTKAQGGSGDSSRKGRHFVDGNTDGLLIAFVTVVATGSGEGAEYEQDGHGVQRNEQARLHEVAPF